MPRILTLILIPSALTLAANLLRLYLQVEGQLSTRSGGSFAWLGIVWLGLLSGAWFGFRLRRAGSKPRLGRAPAWALLALLAVMVTVALSFAAVDRSDVSDAAYAELRVIVFRFVLICCGMAGLFFYLWPRLALTLLAYAIPARLTVVGLTWWAKTAGWDTHYTKFGPAGIERELPETMLAASVAQLGFWVPFTVLSGGFCGCIAAAWTRATKD